MRKIKFTEIQRFAVVTTGHITLEDSKILAMAAKRDQGTAVLPIVFDYPYGWFVHVPPAGGLEAEMERNKKCGLSEAYRRLIRECCEQGIHFLRLDQDGDTIDGLEYFDW
jgi:hypothetical protein